MSGSGAAAPRNLTRPPPDPSRPPRGLTLLRAAGTLWLPALLPFVFGPLTECGHCVRTYGMLLPVEPGLLLGVLLRAGGFLFAVAAAAGTLLALLVVYVVLRQAGRRWQLVALSCGALSAAHALAVGAVLRA